MCKSKCYICMCNSKSSYWGYKYDSLSIVIVFDRCKNHVWRKKNNVTDIRKQEMFNQKTLLNLLQKKRENICKKIKMSQTSLINHHKVFNSSLKTRFKFTNILPAIFGMKVLWAAFFVLTVSPCIFGGQKVIYQKAVCKVLLKLTTRIILINF